MGLKLDEKDRKIIELLKERGDLTVRQIASKLGLPITTAHNRIKRLKSLGVIKRFTISVDHKKIGKGLSAYVLVTIDSKYMKHFRMSQHDLIKQLARLEFVERADIVTGDIDIILLVRVRDVEELDRVIVDKLRDIQGIEKTQTLVILKEEI
ncbi:MAG: Lrp/AsnC family transcriptional regulator [Candidatus Aenigmarchaeota archaeon]|nr:Lrp/AsnC family transcriptional regulator [Candidatus Aenigmarchaeota archaeon]